jgi:integrase
MKRLRPQDRGGIWYLVRRVPKHLQRFDERRFVKVTTGIRVVDDPRGARAARVLSVLNMRLEEDWADLAAGRDPEARRALERAREMASTYGVAYQPAAELGVGPLSEILHRLDLLEQAKGGDDLTADALFGGLERPEMRVSELVEAYEQAQSAALSGHSQNQLKQWRGHKLRAARTAISVFGDKSLLALTRDDGLAFRRHFQRRIAAGEMTIKTANIEISHLTKMLRTVDMERAMGIPLEAFANLRFEGSRDGRRPPFSVEHIRDALLAEGALSGLNEEARRVVYVMIDTGMRPVEIVNLLPEHIRLDAEVPHVAIIGEGRRLKTFVSERTMPLVGCALAAMRLQPKGFPSYRDRSDVLSREVNAYLADNGLRPTPEHTLYGLRHSFEDRLTALDPPDKIIGRLMGHKQYRVRYGDGPSLSHLQGWLERIAFTPPASL